MNKEYYKELIEGIDVQDGSLHECSMRKIRLAEEVLRNNSYTTSIEANVLYFSRGESK